VKAQELSHRYALAVFSEALKKWLVALDIVQNALANEPALSQELENSTRPFESRKAELDKLLPGDTDKAVRNFLYTMLRDGDIGLLSEVVEELSRMSWGGPLVQVARVTTAIALSEDEMDQFRQKLRAKYGQNVELDFNVDPAIVGGAIVQLGDRIIDGSVTSRLEAMSNALGVKRSR
jgi:F-type H+-transporting ATPase subunit delta